MRISLRNAMAACAALYILVTAFASAAPEDKYVLPDVDKTRKERISVLSGRKLMVPEGFVVEEVAGNDLVKSVVNMTFDAKGRPTIAREGAGVFLLEDKDGDGKADSAKEFSIDIKTAHGMYWLGPGDLLVNASGPKGDGLYRLTDTDGDDKADKVTPLIMSKGGIGEHGPHAILKGADGSLYVEYGNHSFPDTQVDPASPSRRLAEDNLLQYYVDPRGHAVNIRAPGGTIQRYDIEKNKMSQFVGGFRNAFDMTVNMEGEIFTFDSDMEWDVGLPWYRPIQVIHCVAGADYGWRTGSAWLPENYIDTLPPVDGIGRGSPVGVAFYYHTAYPSAFYGALFTGDWSRGRIRVMFPKKEGATYEGKDRDFVLGEPLNVTDMDVGPDGCLYFSVGGRGTTGGIYRVRYTAAKAPEVAKSDLDAVLTSPMPRFAWGIASIAKAKEKMGADWEKQVKAAAADTKRSGEQRERAIEALQVYGPKPDLAMLTKLSTDKDPAVRGAAIALIGTFDIKETQETLTKVLADSDPFVLRRTCEALIRSGLNEEMSFKPGDALPTRLFDLLDHKDRFVRYSANLTLMRIDRKAWADAVLADNLSKRKHGALEGLLALEHTASTPEDSDKIFAKLGPYSKLRMDDETTLNFLRVMQLAFIRDKGTAESRKAFKSEVGPGLLAKFPTKNMTINRELQEMLAYMQTPGAIAALQKYQSPKMTQQEQIHTTYCLRSITEGWTREQRDKAVAWFDYGRDIGGGASMEGYINYMWEAILKILPEDEKKTAFARKEKAIADRTERAAKLMAKVEGDRGNVKSDLAQMSFKELSEYLEYDIMSYKGNPDRGEVVFKRAKCADCHVFGKIGKGGGPDLSTVVKRFRRSEILESIMYPSKVISDQYIGLIIDLKNNDTVTGLMAAENDTTLTVITPTGERVDIPKAKIKERRPSKVSIMPEGLLGTMTQGDLVDLMLFLERGSDM